MARGPEEAGYAAEVVALRSGDIVRIERVARRRTPLRQAAWLGEGSRVQAPSDAARPNHARVVLEPRRARSCVLLVRALRSGYIHETLPRGRKRKRASQKESTKKKARKDEPPPNLGSWLGRGRAGRDGDPPLPEEG